MTWLAFIDYAAVFIFALTGALTASRAQLDPVGFLFLACLVGVGGGTLRDLLLDRPVFWMDTPTYILVACIAAIVVFFTAHLVESRLRVLIWLDSAALGVAVSAGVGVALGAAQSAPIVVLIGIVTGCMGGLMRDIVVNEVPLILRQGELYVSAAFGGACAGLLAHTLGAAPLIVLVATMVMTWGLRAGSQVFGWRLPTYRSRPPRR